MKKKKSIRYVVIVVRRVGRDSKHVFVLLLFLLFYFMRAAGNHKCRRKDTWERLQRRHTERRATVRHVQKPMWVPVESNPQQCQTMAPSRPVRPNRLPLTSEYQSEKRVYEFPSPTAVSLDGGDSPPELASKSSSAPHLVKSTQTLPRTARYEGSEVYLRIFILVSIAFTICQWRLCNNLSYKLKKKLNLLYIRLKINAKHGKSLRRNFKIII